MKLIASGLAAERGGRRVFSGIEIAVASGELVWLAGPNGSGKSTLLRVLAGLLAPAEGAIRVEPGGDAPIGESVHYLGHQDGLKPALTIADNLSFWQRLYGAGRRGVAEALDAVGLEPLAFLPAAYLSAGQRRRLAIARLLVADRPIWLLDEPTTALDAASEARLGTLISEHLAGGGMAVAASHGPLPATVTRTLSLGAVT